MRDRANLHVHVDVIAVIAVVNVVVVVAVVGKLHYMLIYWLYCSLPLILIHVFWLPPLSRGNPS